MSDNNDKYNHGGMLAFIFSMAFVLCFFIYLVVIHPGVDLKENIRAVEAATADAGPAFDPSSVKEPWVSSESIVKYGAKVFAQNCAMCHGDHGMGDGPAGAALNPKPRNLVEGPWKKGAGLIAHFDVVTNGLPGTSMSAYKHLKLVDRWALVHFIESITKVKGSDDAAKVAEFGKAAQ